RSGSMWSSSARCHGRRRYARSGPIRPAARDLLRIRHETASRRAQCDTRPPAVKRGASTADAHSQSSHPAPKAGQEGTAASPMSRTRTAVRLALGSCLGVLALAAPASAATLGVDHEGASSYLHYVAAPGETNHL